MLIQTKRTIAAMKTAGFEHGKNKDFTVETPFNRSVGGYGITKVFIRSLDARERIVTKAAELAATQDLDICIMHWTDNDGHEHNHPIVTEGTGKLEILEIENLNK